MESVRLAAEERAMKTGPLPFRSRDANNNEDRHQGPSWSSEKKRTGNGLYSFTSNSKVYGNGAFRTKDSPNGLHEPNYMIGPQQSNKENVSSWLDQSSSPMSVISHHEAATELPPSPSPVCSTSPSTFASGELHRRDDQANRNFEHDRSTNTPNYRNDRMPDSAPTDPSTSKRHGKGFVHFEVPPPPDSPNGSFHSFTSESFHSFTSESSFLSLLASKLFWYREHHKLGSSRYAKGHSEGSGPIDEKHVMEDRSQKPPIDEIALQPDHFQTGATEAPHHPLYRTVSEAASELSLGSAQDRTLSMEFNAMLAAAVAAGVTQANSNAYENQLTDIQEDSFMGSSFSADPQSHNGSSLTVMREGRENEEVEFGNLSEMSLSLGSSSRGSQRAGPAETNMQIVPMTPTSQPLDNSHMGNDQNSVSLGVHSMPGSNRDSLALVLVGEDPHMVTSSAASSSHLETSLVMSAQGRAKGRSYEGTNIQALEKLRRDKVLAQALAYQDAKNAKHNNWYKREEAKINALENQQKINATMNMKKVEMKLEAKRAKALERMQNDMARARKKAEERKASAEAVRAARTVKTAAVANTIRQTGKMPTDVGCFPF